MRAWGGCFKSFYHECHAIKERMLQGSLVIDEKPLVLEEEEVVVFLLPLLSSMLNRCALLL